MNWADVANAENSRDANCGPLSETTVSVTPHVPSEHIFHLQNDRLRCRRSDICDFDIYIYMDSNRPSLCTCSPSPHIGHSRSFAMDTEATVCSSGAPSAGLTGALGNVRSVSRSRLSLSISQATISIRLARSRHFVFGFRSQTHCIVSQVFDLQQRFPNLPARMEFKSNQIKFIYTPHISIKFRGVYSTKNVC